MKKVLSVFFVLVVVLSLTACLPDEAKNGSEKTYEVDNLTITLTDSFMHMSSVAPDFTDCYGATDVSVFFQKETFESLEATGDETVAQYAEAVRESIDVSDILNEDGVTYMEYSGESDGTTYKYFAAMFKGPDAFWLVQFACEDSAYEEYKPYFVDWAKTVEFSE